MPDTSSLSRSTDEEINRDYALIRDQQYLVGVFDAVSVTGIIVNDNRQIIFAGEEFLRFLDVPIGKVLGRKPGEVFGCVHADTDPRGCGAAESCRFCGAVKTFLESRKTGTRAQNDARITTTVDGVRKSWDFRVTAIPLAIADSDYTVVSLQDIGDELRRTAWERVFFHDVLNTAGSLRSALELCTDEKMEENQRRELMAMCRRSSRSLVDEINAQRQIREAEIGSLQPSIEKLSVESVVREAVDTLMGQMISENRAVQIEVPENAGVVYSDKVLLRRVLGNMLKNAVEAAPPNTAVTLRARPETRNVRFEVHNEGVIPPAVGMQIFQRSFSTKGNNRGLGTYSMKLIGEEHLRGRVGFESTEHEGTTFHLILPREDGGA